MGWRNAQASVALIGEINARWPGRDRSSDGTIGDAAHAARTSDHNPWLTKGGQGIVRARDIDKDGIDAAWLAEHLRQLGAKGDRRLRPGGYIIFNRRITKPDFSGWKVYTGSNPHTKHVHVSFSTDASSAGFDSTASWGISGAPTPAKPGPAVGSFPTIRRGDRGPAVRIFQRFRGLTPDGDFGPATEASAKAYQQMKGLRPVDGVVGPATWAATGL